MSAKGTQRVKAQEMPMKAAMIVAVTWVWGRSVVSRVIEKRRWERDQARGIVMRRRGWDRLESFELVSLMREGMSMFVARAKMEKIRLAREPRRMASSMISACAADEVFLASNGAASTLN